VLDLLGYIILGLILVSPMKTGKGESHYLFIATRAASLERPVTGVGSNLEGKWVTQVCYMYRRSKVPSMPLLCMSVSNVVYAIVYTSNQPRMR
jgi:hypothetical protein